MRTAGRILSGLLLFHVAAFKAPGETTTTLSITNQFGGSRVQLNWNTEPGARHRVSTTTNLTGGMWRELDLYESIADNGVWLDPQATTNLQFYSVTDPEPEVFDMDPPVIDFFAGSSSYIYGQFIPSNAALQVVTETSDGGAFGIRSGVSSQTFNLILEANGVWRIDFPPGSFTAAMRILSAAIVDGNGTVLTPVALDLELSEYKRARDVPADAPVAAPSPWYEKARLAIVTDGSAIKRAPAPGLPGEVAFHEVDLDMETPAGPPLRWVRTYRSKFPVSSGFGESWDFNYNISIFPESADGTNTHTLLLKDGSGRQDRLHRGTDGIYRADGLFREGHFEGDVFVLTFADQGTWRFRPLTNSLEEAKIDRIVDRFGVALTCSYDASSNLASVHDDFGRSLHINWEGGRIASVSNHVGHRVDYTYNFEQTLAVARLPGEETSTYAYEGYNLTSITDYEGRVLESFTYSTQSNPAEPDYDTVYSHNINPSAGTSVVEIITFGPVPDGLRAPGGYTMFLNDELGRLTEVVCDARHRPIRMREFTGFCTPGEPVSATSNRPANPLRPEDPAYFETTFAYNTDHALTRISYPDGSGFNMVYERDINPAATALERGNMRTASMIPEGGGSPVKVSLNYLTGFGTPESARPGNPIRGVTVKGGRNPGGDIVVGANARPGNPIRGVIVKGGRNPPGDPVPSAKPGGPVKGASIKNPHKLCGDPECNLCKGHRARMASPSGALLSSVGFGIDTMEYSARVADPFGGESYPDTGPAFDAASNPVTGIGIVVKHTPNCTGCKRCRNNAARGAHPSELGEGDHDAVELPAMLRNLLGYDTSAENIGMPVSMARDGLLWRWDYNEDGALIRGESPIPGSGIEAEYNSLGQCTLTRMIDGTNAYVSSITYGGDSFVSSISAQRGSYSSTAYFFYDSLGRLKSLIDPSGQDAIYDYNEAGQLTTYLSPLVAASRVQQTFTYGPAGRLERMDVEHRDEAGNLVVENTAYSTIIHRDLAARIVRELIEERPAEPIDPVEPSDYRVVEYTYDDAGQIVRVSTPAASLEQPQDEVCDYSYDERGFLHRVIAGGVGAPGSITSELSYDLYGNLTRQAVVTGGVIAIEESFEYDGFQRTIKAKDAAGNITRLAFGERGWVTAELYGELNDVPGTNQNVLLYRSRSRGADGVLMNGCGAVCMHSAFAVRDRSALWCWGNNAHSGFLMWPVEDDVIEIDRFMPGSMIAAGTRTNYIDRSPAGLPLREMVNGDLIYAYGYDAFGDLISITNAAQRADFTRDTAGRITGITRTDHVSDGVTPSKSFTTTYSYDPLGRLASITDGGGNHHVFAYDSLGRLVKYTDATGTMLDIEYDGGTGADAFSRRVIGDLDRDGTPETFLGAQLTRSGREKRRIKDTLDYTSIVRDSLGRVTSIDHPDGTHELFAYDDRGFPVRYTKQDGSIIEHEVHPNGAVHRSNPIHVPPSAAHTPELNYTYNGRGELTGIHTAGGPSVMYQYDSWGNLIVDQQEYGSVTNTHDHRGRTGYASSAGGLHVTEQRDALGRLISISRNGAMVATLTYVGDRLHQSISGNGTTTTFDYRGDGDAPFSSAFEDYGFDQLSRILVESSATQETTEELRGYDRNMRRQAVQVSAGGATRNKYWSFDALGRTANYSSQAIDGGSFTSMHIDYTLATDGTRLSVAGGANEGTYSKSDAIPPGDAQMSQYTTWPNGPVEWTDNGELARLSQPAGGNLYYLYDAYGRMVTVTNDTGPILDTDSDGDGRVIQTTTYEEATGIPQTTRFIYNGGVCIQEIREDGSVIASRVASGGAVFGLTINGTNYYTHGGMIEPNTFKYPILPIDKPPPIKEVETNDDITLPPFKAARPGRPDPFPPGHDPSKEPTSFKYPTFSAIIVRIKEVETDDDITLPPFRQSRPATTISDEGGTLVEVWDADQDGVPVVLPLVSSSSAGDGSAVGPLKWKAPELLWLPEVRLLHTPVGAYNPDLGRLCGKVSHF